MLQPLEVHGDPPNLDGQVCESVLAEEYWYMGNLGEPANVVWIRCSGIWHRLCFDFGIIFWRRSTDGPRPYTMPELDGEVRITDVGTMLGLIGDVIIRYDMQSIPDGSEVCFRFASGKNLVLRNVNDRTTYAS